jgi:transcription elongation factor Elf1
MENQLDLALQEHELHEEHEVSSNNEILILEPLKYKGGIAIWGALNPVYNTHDTLKESGVHVHAREEVGGVKVIDATFEIVRVQYLKDGKTNWFEINGFDASQYNIATIFKRKLKYLICPICNNVHSDSGFNAVTYHSTHECEHCGSEFEDSERSISSPIMLLKELCGDVLQERIVIDPVDRIMNAKQERFLGGIQLWGSNPAIIWTSPKYEEGGIHFHGFRKINSENPEADETFGTVKIDGVFIDHEQVRHLMAQNSLNYLKGKMQTVHCPVCNISHFDKFDEGLYPHKIHECENCGSTFESEKSIVGMPLIDILNNLNINKQNII